MGWTCRALCNRSVLDQACICQCPLARMIHEPEARVLQRKPSVRTHDLPLPHIFCPRSWACDNSSRTNTAALQKRPSPGVEWPGSGFGSVIIIKRKGMAQESGDGEPTDQASHPPATAISAYCCELTLLLHRQPGFHALCRNRAIWSQALELAKSRKKIGWGFQMG
jgi:hypothetical protein